jgi:PAS domain S-box-containing protein
MLILPLQNSYMLNDLMDVAYKGDVLDVLPSAVNISDDNGNFIYVNQQACEITGYSEDELLGRNWSILYSPEEYLDSQPKFELLLLKKKWSGQVTMQRKNGSSFPAYVSLSVLPSGLFSCVFSNIEEQISQQTKLNDLSQAVASTMDGIALLNAEGKYYYLNEKHITHFGYTREEELLGKTWQVFYPDYEVKRIEEDLFPKLARDGRWQGETTGVCKDGTPIYQEITLTGLPHGGLICIMRNITEKKVRDNEIRKLALVASNTNNAVVITNALQQIEWMNEKAEIIFERSQQDINRSSLLDVLAEMQLEKGVIETLQRNIDKGVSGKLDIHLQKKHGEDVWLSLSINPVYEKAGVVNYVCLFWDVTDSKDAENKLTTALNKEKSLNDLKTHFVNLTSHEFRTPLTSIQSSLDIIKLLYERDVVLSRDKLGRHLEQMEYEVDRMKELMDNVLVLGKINSGKIDYKPKMNDVVELVKEIVQSSRIKQFGKTVTLNITGLVTEVFSDKRLLEHILYNLIINALKYSPDSDKSPVIDMSFKKQSLQFSVTDYGIGIPMNDQAHIFESFYRASNTQNMAGTGLGLPIVKQFVELHSGAIWFESSPGNKTVFSFEIPFI